ncbi:transposable element Tcb1 transposase [Trichonephila clavipes]|nr:transposable element Tcb1 transposase [Trichonephila clavipes]
MQMIRISAQTHITCDCGTTSKRYLRLEDFDDFKFGNCVFLVVFSKNDQLSRRKQRSAFHQVSEFDRGRIVANRDCGLSFREIGSRVARNQITVMRISDRWMQESTTDRRGRSHPLQYTTSCEDRQIVRIEVTDHSVASRTVAQYIDSVTHHSVSARTIRSRLHQSDLSARHPLLGLPFTQNHRRLHGQWCDERRLWAAEWNEVVFTDESRICLQNHDVRIIVWRHRGERMLNSCVMHRHTGPAPGIMEWVGIGYHSRTHLLRIAGTLNSQHYISEVLEPVDLPYFQGLATAIFQQDNTRPHVARIVQKFFINHQIELLPWPARSPDLSPIENMWSMVAQRLTQIITAAATPDQLRLLYPKNKSKVFLNQYQGVWQR